MAIDHGVDGGGGGGRGEERRRAPRNNELLHDRDLIRRWLAWGLGWLLLFPTVGVLISTKFNYPEFLGTRPGSPSGGSGPSTSTA